ncbi:MAG: hypothetical protein KDD67_03110 [Ignavibacteriae bacterium]|nr:hypothetical protein [Ignavibacteriota bacterium]MCB9217029.1 hypothetical protein [Ignavibacteria bacterium]
MGKGGYLFVTDETIWDPKTGEVWINTGDRKLARKGKKLFPINGKTPFKITDPERLKIFYPDNLGDLISKSLCMVFEE